MQYSRDLGCSPWSGNGGLICLMIPCTWRVTTSIVQRRVTDIHSQSGLLIVVRTTVGALYVLLAVYTLHKAWRFDRCVWRINFGGEGVRNYRGVGWSHLDHKTLSHIVQYNTTVLYVTIRYFTYCGMVYFQIFHVIIWFKAYMYTGDTFTTFWVKYDYIYLSNILRCIMITLCIL